jgi:hypothetical protein
MTEIKPRTITATSSVGAKPAAVRRRHPGDTQSALVLVLTMVATLVAVYDLFLLSFIAR